MLQLMHRSRSRKAAFRNALKLSLAVDDFCSEGPPPFRLTARELLADELEALFDLLARAELVLLLFPPDLRYPPDTAMQDTLF